MSMDCGKCRELLLDYIYGELDELTAASVAAHLEGCPKCDEAERTFRATLARLDVLTGDEMPESSSAAIRETLSREMLLARPGGARGSYGLFSRRYTLAAAVVLVAAVAVFLFKDLGGPRIVVTREAYAQAQVEHVAYELTVFNEDLALVKDKRIIMKVVPGVNLVRFADVASMIDPTSVRFESTTDPVGTRVLEQNYEYDLATPSALLRKFLDRRIQCISKDGMLTEGYLASFGAGPAPAPAYLNLPPAYQVERRRLQREVQQLRQQAASRPTDGLSGMLVLTAEPGKGQTAIVSVDDLTSIRLPTVPEGLLVKPTLVWRVKSARAGRHDTLLTYQTRGFSWNADYVVTVGKGDVLDWQGWVTVNNRSGTRYPDAKLKLIAGDVHKVQEQRQFGEWNGAVVESAVGYGAERRKAFEEKAFFEYHLYTLSEPTTLNNNQTKQIKLLKASDVTATRRYVFDARQNATNALVELEVWNRKENHLGMPLPKGRVRFRQADPDDELQYVGEDTIDHTPKDEKLTLKLGTAFDIVGERKQVRTTTSGRTRTESYRIRIRNHKTKPVEVIVREHPATADWRITVSSTPEKKIDVNTIEFPLTVPANAERSVSYTIFYRW